jgi:hypothetical protein
MIKVTRHCDKCKAEVDEKEQFWNMEIRCYEGSYKTDFQTPVKTLQVCRPCLESFGIHVIRKDNEKPKPVPTIESLFKAILELAQGG